MEDEVLKHTQKIYKTVKNKDHSFGEKVTEIFIEICIIVFAVSLSIWFHNWSEHRHEQKEVKEFLTGLKDDLQKDIEVIKTNRQTISELDSNYNALLSLANDKNPNDKTDSARYKFSVFIPVTRPNIGRYEGFKSSGKIGTIENDSLKEKILIYYQQTIPNVVYGENFVNSSQLKILDAEMEQLGKGSMRSFMTSPKTQALLNLTRHNFNVNIKAYDNTIKEANDIISEIDKEIRK